MVVDDMNDSRSWALGSRCYEYLRVMDPINDFESWPQGSIRYEQLKLQMTWMTLGHSLRILDAMNR